MDIVERLRSVIRLLCETEDMIYDEDNKLAFEAADEIERLRLLVHYAFCEGQITPLILEDWINSRSYAALKEGE